MALGGAGVATLMIAGRRSAGTAGAAATPADDGCVSLVPADKGLSAEWIASLYRRGEPTVSSGTALQYIGMPVGGGCCGELYLGGDGTLWKWDILNEPASGTSDTAYANPAARVVAVPAGVRAAYDRLRCHAHVDA